MDEIPSAVLVASVRLEHGYDQSGEAGVVVPALSPRPPRPAHPPKSALLARAAAVTPPEPESPIEQVAVLRPWLSQLDYHIDAQPARLLPSVLV